MKAVGRSSELFPLPFLDPPAEPPVTLGRKLQPPLSIYALQRKEDKQDKKGYLVSLYKFYFPLLTTILGLLISPHLPSVPCTPGKQHILEHCHRHLNASGLGTIEIT